MAIQFIQSEEQTMLRDGLRRWGNARDVRESEDFDATWAYGAEQGWLMAGLPEEAGGLGGTPYDSALIAEELGRALVRAPFVEVGMVAAQLLLRVAPDRVEDIAMGGSRPVLAHDEAEARGDTSFVATRAVRDGEGWRLTGRKTGIVGAGHADTLLVSAMVEGEGIALFEMPAEGAPLRLFTTIDDRSGGELLLDATPATLLTGAPDALPAIEEALDYALVMESAEAVGAMERALEMTKDYLLTRKQYGQLIGDFQALRHRLADMFIEAEQARSIVLRGLEALMEAAPARRAALAAAVKARVAQAGHFVGGNGIQLHGGIGVTDEYPVGHFYKRLIAFDSRHGGSARQVERFAELSAAG
jgi:alkylation response protein AidB-like acyl-CoA dehydrogenase